MAESNLSAGMNRRSLLTSAAALTFAHIVPAVDCPEAAGTKAIAPISPLFTAQATPNVCAATARRLREIAARNELRRQAGLPLLSVSRELRRMKIQADAEEFDGRAAVHRKVILAEILRQRREAEDNPNWTPNWMQAMAWQNEVDKKLAEALCARGPSSPMPSP